MTIYEQLGKDLSAFDDSPERSEIEAIEVEQKRDREAIKNAETIISEARAEIRKIKTESEDIDELVDGLRTGEIVEKPSETVDALTRKIEAYILGKSKLQRAMHDRSLQIDGIKGRLRLRMSEVVDDLDEALDKQVRASLSQLAKQYAEISACAAGFQTSDAKRLQSKLTNMFHAIGSDWPEMVGRLQPVAPELVDAMKQGEKSIDLVDCHIRDTVLIPRR